MYSQTKFIIMQTMSWCNEQENRPIKYNVKVQNRPRSWYTPGAML